MMEQFLKKGKNKDGLDKKNQKPSFL